MPKLRQPFLRRISIIRITNNVINVQIPPPAPNKPSRRELGWVVATISVAADITTLKNELPNSTPAEGITGIGDFHAPAPTFLSYGGVRESQQSGSTERQIALEVDPVVTVRLFLPHLPVSFRVESRCDAVV